MSGNLPESLIEKWICNDKHRMERPNRDGMNSLSGVVNQESACDNDSSRIGILPIEWRRSRTAGVKCRKPGLCTC
jgi:hypothetical protein